MPYRPPSEPDPPVPLAVRLARRWGVDRAVAFAVLARIWQLLTGPITQLLIIFFLTELQQGYYYAFLNLLAMQIFVELGLHVVLINVSSHEWSGLSLHNGRIKGDSVRRARLVSLGRTAVKWYAAAAIIFLAAVAAGGIWFFEDTQTVQQAKTAESLPAVMWVAPWLGLVCCTGLQLILLPLTAILEGCGQLPVVNRIRFWQGIAGTAAVWTLLAAGWGLWALVGSAAVRLLGELYLVAVRYREFFSVFRSPPPQEQFSWKDEVLPLQWRMAIQGALLWLATHLAGLVIFRYHGAVPAGQFGMMWTILTAVQAASLAWVETRRPLFGTLIAERRFQELDARFFKFSRISLSLMLIGGAGFSLSVWVVGHWSNWLFDRIAQRLPPVEVVGLCSLALVIMHLAQCTNIYVRAHKRDPFLAAAVLSNLTIAGLVYGLGRHYGMAGVASGYLAGVSLVQVPLWVTIWWQTRRDWHTPDLSQPTGS